MAVPKYRRTENQLDILNICQDVFSLSLQLIKNEKIIPKKNFKIIAEPMLENIRQLMYTISQANNMYTKSLQQLEYRYQFQFKARQTIVKLLVDIQIAINLSTTTNAAIKFDHLLDKIEELKSKLQSWTKQTKDMISSFNDSKDSMCS